MSWFSGITDTVGSAFSGLSKTVTDLANSDAAQTALELAAKNLTATNDSIATAGTKTGVTSGVTSTASSSLPSWAVHAGIGVAMLLVVFLMAKELK